VFFEFDKSDITPDAATILDNAVSAYANCGNAQVMLAGHADRSGTPKYNLGLSQRRADAAKAYLVSKGIGDGVITTQAFGEEKPRCSRASEPPRGNHLRPRFGHVMGLREGQGLSRSILQEKGRVGDDPPFS